MEYQFADIVDKMKKRFRELDNTEAISQDDVDGKLKRGIYVIYHKKQVMYVGRSNRESIKKRILRHSSPGKPIGFARKLAEKLMSESSKSKITNENAVDYAKNMIRRMKVKVVPIKDRNEQAIFEMWAAVQLNSKYNHLDTI